MPEHSNLSQDEAEKLREMLLQYDRDRVPNVFDLSNPPTKPYKHQEFPKIVYDHAKSVKEHADTTKDVLGNVQVVAVPHFYATKTVASQEELDAALDAGYSETPPTFEDHKEEAFYETAVESVKHVADGTVKKLFSGRKPPHKAKG